MFLIQVQICSHDNHNSGGANSVGATKIGHTVSCYLIGIIFLCAKDKTTRENELKMLRGTLMESIIRCWGMFRRMLTTIWIRSKTEIVAKPPVIYEANEKMFSRQHVGYRKLIFRLQRL